MFLLTFSTFALADHHEGWVTMFNGRTLEGWTQKNGFTRFDSRNGFISASPLRGGSGVSYLCTVGEFGDFELELEVKLDSRFGEDFASAIQIRSHASTEGDDSTLNLAPFTDHR